MAGRGWDEHGGEGRGARDEVKPSFRARHSPLAPRPSPLPFFNTDMTAKTPDTVSTKSLWREPAGAIPNTLALSYASLGYIEGFVLMAQPSWVLAAIGVLLTVHAMVIATYLVHEAAHTTLFAAPAHNRMAGEAMSWIAGSAYASFERIRHMHLRHHRDRADVTCFDYKSFLRRRPALRRLTYALEWMHIPAVEMLMHAQVILRPLIECSQRSHLPRAASVLVLRVALFVALTWVSVQAALLYLLAYALLLVVLNFFDAFHHTFDQYFVDALEQVPTNGRDRNYEQANTYSNVVSVRHPWINLLTLNFGYHNAHHERAATPWYDLPALNRELFGNAPRELLPFVELIRTHHRNRLKRVLDDDYGSVGSGKGRADGFIGAHGVSFLTVV
jgi:fatty acid desaturase